jgi:hypothetical protein
MFEKNSGRSCGSWADSEAQMSFRGYSSTRIFSGVTPILIASVKGFIVSSDEYAPPPNPKSFSPPVDAFLSEIGLQMKNI